MSGTVVLFYSHKVYFSAWQCHGCSKWMNSRVCIVFECSQWQQMQTEIHPQIFLFVSNVFYYNCPVTGITNCVLYYFIGMCYIPRVCHCVQEGHRQCQYCWPAGLRELPACLSQVALQNYQGNIPVGFVW